MRVSLPHSGRDTLTWLEVVLLVVLLADFARVGARLIGLDTALTWDEAVYAVRARGYADDSIVVSGWHYIRPPLLPILSIPSILAGGDEWQLRAIGLLAGLGLLLAAWWTGRLMDGPLAGLVAAAILAISSTVQLWSGRLMTDVPATVLILMAVALAWRELEIRPRPGIGLAAAVLAGGLAFYIRYGSLLLLVPLAAVIAVIWWRRLLAGGRATVAAVAVGATMAVGHLAWSVAQTGSPLGIIRDAQDVVVLLSRQNAFDAYRGWLGFDLAGPVGSAVALLGMATVPASLAAAMGRRSWPRWARASLMLAVPAVVQVAVLLTSVNHVEPRFFLPSTALLVVAGACAMSQLARAATRHGSLLAAAILGAALVMTHGPVARSAFEATQAGGSFYGPFRIIGTTMRDATSPECGLATIGYPIVAWYSACAAAGHPKPGGYRTGPDPLAAGEPWLILAGPVDGAGGDHPLVAESVAPPLVIRDPVTGRELAVAWRLAPR